MAGGRDFSGQQERATGAQEGDNTPEARNNQTERQRREKARPMLRREQGDRPDIQAGWALWSTHNKGQSPVTPSFDSVFLLSWGGGGGRSLPSPPCCLAHTERKHSFTPWFLNLRVYQNHLEDLLKHRLLSPASRISDSFGLGLSGPKMCIYSNFSGNTDGAGLGVTLRGPLVKR